MEITIIGLVILITISSTKARSFRPEDCEPIDYYYDDYSDSDYSDYTEEIYTYKPSRPSRPSRGKGTTYCIDSRYFAIMGPEFEGYLQSYYDNPEQGLPQIEHRDFDADYSSDYSDYSMEERRPRKRSRKRSYRRY